MKNSTKWIASVATAAAIFFSVNVKAQTAASSDKSPWRLGFGIEGGIPTGDAHPSSSFELGGSARLQYSLNNTVALTLTSGYTNFFIKDDYRVPGGPSSVGIVPAKVGAKFFVAPSIYLGAEAGVAEAAGDVR